MNIEAERFTSKIKEEWEQIAKDELFVPLTEYGESVTVYGSEIACLRLKNAFDGCDCLVEYADHRNQWSFTKR